MLSSFQSAKKIAEPERLIIAGEIPFKKSARLHIDNEHNVAHIYLTSQIQHPREYSKIFLAVVVYLQRAY